MPKLKRSCLAWTLALLFPLFLAPDPLQGQQGEIPSVVEDAASENSRIVEHRPRFYTVKRVVHPVSWLEGGVSPVLRLAERFGGKFAKKDEDKKEPAESGIKFGAKGLGGSTGFGPMIKPYHHNLFNTGIRVEVPAVVTYKMYQSAGFRVTFPLHPEDTNGFDIEALGDYTSRPADFFYGIGNNTAASNASRFRTVSRTAGAAVNLRVQKNWLLRGEYGFRSIGVTKPREPKPMELVFQGQDIPGMMTGATMNVASASFQRDTKDNPYWASTGGLQRIEASLAEGKRGGDFSYWRYRAEVQQFLPLSDDNRKVIALRADLETNRPKGGSSVPFFDLPGIGGSRTLRGFSTNRFTDRTAMTASAEYRYRIWRYFDWGVFMDVGQVAPEIGNFALDNFHTGYGVRFFARSLKRRGVIVDLAHSREAWTIYIDFRPLF